MGLDIFAGILEIKSLGYSDKAQEWVGLDIFAALVDGDEGRGREEREGEGEGGGTLVGGSWERQYSSTHTWSSKEESVKITH